MAYLTRRSFLRSSLALAAAGSVAHPYIANAAATTATVWWAQGFVQDEDVALKKVVADYEKASGNKIELSITPFAPERQKIIAALTSGVVPDVLANNPGEIVQIYGWQDRWVDVSDVVETQKSQLSETAIVSGQAYNNVTKKVGQYGVPIRAAVVPCHIWRPLVEKMGPLLMNSSDTVCAWSRRPPRLERMSMMTPAMSLPSSALALSMTFLRLSVVALLKPVRWISATSSRRS